MVRDRWVTGRKEATQAFDAGSVRSLSEECSEDVGETDILIPGEPPGYRIMNTEELSGSIGAR